MAENNGNDDYKDLSSPRRSVIPEPSNSEDNGILLAYLRYDLPSQSRHSWRADPAAVMRSQDYVYEDNTPDEAHVKRNDLV